MKCFVIIGLNNETEKVIELLNRNNNFKMLLGHGMYKGVKEECITVECDSPMQASNVIQHILAHTKEESVLLIKGHYQSRDNTAYFIYRNKTEAGKLQWVHPLDLEGLVGYTQPNSAFDFFYTFV